MSSIRASFKESIRYSNSAQAGFQKAVRNRVDEVIRKHGGSRKAPASFAIRVVLLLALHFVLWGALALNTHSVPMTFGLLTLFAFVSQTIVVTTVHEAGHDALTGKRDLDYALTWFSFHLLGPNARLFRLRHNDVHHMYSNIPGLDTDIESSTIIRFVPHVAWKPIHRFQHLYAPVLYTLFTLVWIFFKDFKVLRQKEIGNLTGIQHTLGDRIEFYALKIAYVALMIGVPALALPYSLGTVLLGFLAYHAILSSMITMTIASSHIFEGTEFPMPNEKGELPYSFIEHAFRTCADFSPKSRLMGFFYGGFNAHVAHHAFPTMSSVHYPEISRVLEETAREYGIQYHRFSLPGQLLSHLRMLKYLGSHPNAGKELLVSIPGESASARGIMLRLPTRESEKALA